MTEHYLAEDTAQDTQTMKNLRNFVLSFVAFAVLLAFGVALFAP